MKKSRLDQLFAAARREAAPEPRPGFDGRVAAAITRMDAPARPARSSATWLDPLAGWLPRLAVATVVVVGICFAADGGGDPAAGGDLGEGAEELVTQWFFE